MAVLVKGFSIDALSLKDLGIPFVAWKGLSIYRGVLKFKCLALIVGGLYGLPGTVWADHDGHPPGAPPWHKLSPQERQLLHEHADHWPHYSPEVRRRLHDNANHFLNMTPQERRSVRDRGAQRFQQLSPRQKHRACNRYYRERGRLPPFCRRFQNGRGR